MTPATDLVPVPAPRLAAPARQLDGAIRALAGGALTLLAHCERPWRSATFEGAGHRLVYACEGQDAALLPARLAALLPEHEFALPGHVAIEVSVQAAGGTEAAPLLTVHALTVADG